MKECCGMSMNVVYYRDKDDKLAANMELIFVLSEPQYRLDQGGAVVRFRETETLRMMIRTEQCLALAADMTKSATEEQARAAMMTAAIECAKDTPASKDATP